MEFDPEYPDAKIIEKFDSLLLAEQKLEVQFLEEGFKHLIADKQKNRIHSIVQELDSLTLVELCTLDVFNDHDDFGFCKNKISEEVTHPELQRQLVIIHINDQAERGDIDRDLMAKYNLEDDILLPKSDMMVDEYNRRKLVEIIKEYGYPTIAMVGEIGMETMFLVTQHSLNLKWQKSQLALIEKSISAGDLNPRDYAYLYDRIQTNQNKPQRFGTQSSKIDFVTGAVQFKEIEDSINVDKRRRAYGLMPLDQYRKLLIEVYSTSRE